uniref:Uncharacterized protein n=1 Tax=Plectus sambesii TaxID=2011161 RepID=A0A914X010_9BILA
MVGGPNNGTINQGDTNDNSQHIRNEKGNVNIVGRDMNIGRDLIQTVHHHPPAPPLPPPPPPTPEELKKMLER